MIWLSMNFVMLGLPISYVHDMCPQRYPNAKNIVYTPYMHMRICICIHAQMLIYVYAYIMYIHFRPYLYIILYCNFLPNQYVHIDNYI